MTASEDFPIDIFGLSASYIARKFSSLPTSPLCCSDSQIQSICSSLKFSRELQSTISLADDEDEDEGVEETRRYSSLTRPVRAFEEHGGGLRFLTSLRCWFDKCGRVKLDDDGDSQWESLLGDGVK